MSQFLSPKQAVNQLFDQLSSEKRKLSFLFGAGTSMAVGLPGVIDLSSKIKSKLSGKEKDAFEELEKSASSPNVENILNKLRGIREVIGGSETEHLYKIEGKTFGQNFDFSICSYIAEFVTKSAATSVEPHLNFANWLFKYQANRQHPVELFTTNYDLLFEEAFEEKKIPYFDGFIGAINPFLIPESIEAENTRQQLHAYIPNGWLRFWKIHGSINWYLYKDSGGKNRITRNTGKICKSGDELMIFPSRQKYDESRRLPFLVFQDRLRRFLSQGEILLIINGYSFGDDHINEILFQALRANKRLAITALVYGDVNAKKERRIDDKILSYGKENPNLTILGPDKGCVGSNIAEWKFDGMPTADDGYWREHEKIFDLGDFKTFSTYLKQHFHISD
jgi:hypothetical protein